MKLALLTLPLCLFLVVLPVPAQESAPTPKPGPVFVSAGTIDHPPIDETSGIVKSRTYEDVYWVLNDSGGGPFLFAIDGKGKAILPPWQARRFSVGPSEKGDGRTPWPGMELLVAANLDWEDMAIDGDTLYVADMGNNGNARRDLGVYVLKEPNPRATERMRHLAWIPIAYPDQKKYPAEAWDFDCESLFVADGKLYFLTKHRPAGQMRTPMPGTKLYRLDTRKLGEENVLTLVQSRKDMVWPLAADVSPDGSKLAVVCVNALWVFDRPKSGDHWLSGSARRVSIPLNIIRTQSEAVCWDDGKTIRVACEGRAIWRVDLARLKPVE
ncbi:MAG: hypothetical protein ABFS86_07810 [Planctomycetota bacterium]